MPSFFTYGDDGCPRAWLIWDFMRIGFRTVRDGHRKIWRVGMGRALS